MKNFYFYSLNNLLSLQLSNNQILTIEDETFNGLNSLLVLNLSSNLIYNLTGSLFSNLSSLKVLILRNNKLDYIIKDYFKGLNSLAHLDVSYNQVKIIWSDAFFVYTKKLESLILKSNQIHKLNDSLESLSCLKELDLSFNFINSITNKDLNNLTNLDLSSNRLENIDFNVTNVKSLKSLILSNISFNSSFFINFEMFSKIEILDMSENIFIYTSNFKYLINIKKLNLKNTIISDFSFLSYLKLIEEFDYSNSNYALFCLLILNPNNKILKISNISLSNSDFVKDFNKLSYLDISHNLIGPIKNLYKKASLKYLDISYNLINEMSSNDVAHDNLFNFFLLFNLEYINLKKAFTVDLLDFQLIFGVNLEYAMISSNNFKTFPKFCECTEEEQFFCRLKTLYYDFNSLKTIYFEDLIYLENLEYLNLDSNQISWIEDDAFYNLHALETLILSNNEISLSNNSRNLFSSLSNIKFINLRSNVIQYLKMNTFSNLFKLEEIDLSENKIFFIEENSFNGLINLRELYINENSENMEIKNSSFADFRSIKTIYISRSILNVSSNKVLFINLVSAKNANENKKILQRNYYKSFNLISLNDTFYDCDLVFELIKYNIQYNLKSEIDFSNYLENCQQREIYKN